MIIKILPDKEKAKSIFQMVESRQQFLEDLEKIKAYPTIIVENYYEVIKELCTAIILIDGYKTIGESAHKELIDLIGKYKEFSRFEIEIIHDLRIRRNKSSYEGKPIELDYLLNKKEIFIKIIIKLKKILERKIV